MWKISLKLDINIDAVMRGESHNREKAIAFEFFMQDDKACYREAFAPSSSKNIGNVCRATLFSISRALLVCAESSEIKEADITVYMNDKTALDLIIDTDDCEIMSLPSNDAIYLKRIRNKEVALAQKGCSVRYVKDNYSESTYELAEYFLRYKKCICEDSIKEAIKKVKCYDSLKNTTNEVVEKIEPGDVLDVTLGNYSFLDELFSKLSDMSSKEKELNDKISELNDRLQIANAYGSSLKNQNEIIKIENDTLNDELLDLKNETINLEDNLKQINKDAENYQSTLDSLQSSISCLKNSIKELQARDNSLIQYLKKELEKLSIEANFNIQIR